MRLVCFSVFIFLFVLQSCAPQGVLTLSKKQAASRLASRNIDFLMKADIDRFGELKRLDEAAPFYAALQLESSLQYLEDIAELDPDKAENTAEDINARIEALLREALNSEVTRAAAAKKLIAINPDSFYDENHALAIKLAAGTEWEAAFRLAGRPQKDALKEYFYNEAPTAAYIWLYKTRKSDPFVDARIFVSRRSYREALVALRADIQGGKMPPEFVRYSELLQDLGKAYQYSSPTEGITLFSKWEEELKKKNGEKAEDLNARYLLLYYAGRMARQLSLGTKGQRYDEGIAFFERAVEAAPDKKQLDACIWYVLDIAFRDKPERSLPYIKKYAAKWDSAYEFDDIFDKISQWAVKERRWDVFLTVFDEVLHNASADTRAKYAYIIGRAVQLGFLRDTKESSYYFDIAYSVFPPAGVYSGGNKITLPVIYYRLLAAKRLSRRDDLDSFLRGSAKTATPSPTTEEGTVSTASVQTKAFLDGFFKWGCAEWAYPYIKEAADSLSFAELRHYAESLEEAKQWKSLINLSIISRARQGFKPVKRDWELGFPRGYKEYIEKYAKNSKLDTPLVFSLIRQESLFESGAYSRQSAAGLTQLMTATAKEVAVRLAKEGGPDYRDEDGGVNLLDAEINIHIGTLYLRELLWRMQNEENAVLAYNGGVTRIKRWRAAADDLSDDLFLESIDFAETREYGRTVLAGRAMYKYLYY